MPNRLVLAAVALFAGLAPAAAEIYTPRGWRGDRGESARCAGLRTARHREPWPGRQPCRQCAAGRSPQPGGFPRGGAEPCRKRARPAHPGIGGGRGGIDRAASDRAAHLARQADFDAILAAEEKRCRVPFKVLAGHSMGARAALVEAGATSTSGIAGRDRFDAYIAISPLGEGHSFFPTGAMKGIRKPVLVITGTEDRSVGGGYESRLATYEGLPPGRKRSR